MWLSHINCWDKLNSRRKFWKFWSDSLCRNKSGPSPLLNVVVYWQSSNTEACAKKLSQILANNIDKRGGGSVSKFMWGVVGLFMSYLWDLFYIFIFILIMMIVWIKTLLFFCLYFQNMFYYFWMITWLNNLNNFQIGKVQPQGVAKHLLDFLPISAWRCL